MSGRRRSSQLTSRGSRVRIELTFQVAIFIKAAIFYRIRRLPCRDASSAQVRRGFTTSVGRHVRTSGPFPHSPRNTGAYCLFALTPFVEKSPFLPSHRKKWHPRINEVSSGRSSEAGRKWKPGQNDRLAGRRQESPACPGRSTLK